VLILKRRETWLAFALRHARSRIVSGRSVADMKRGGQAPGQPNNRGSQGSQPGQPGQPEQAGQAGQAGHVGHVGNLGRRARLGSVGRQGGQGSQPAQIMGNYTSAVAAQQACHALYAEAGRSGLSLPSSHMGESGKPTGSIRTIKDPRARSALMSPCPEELLRIVSGRTLRFLIHTL